MPKSISLPRTVASVMVAALVSTSFLQGCANTAAQGTPANGTPVADKPAATSEANAAAPAPGPVNVAPAAATATGAATDNSYLLGKKYSHAFVQPRVIAKEWSRTLSMEMDKESGLDFMLVKSKENLLAIVGAKGKRLRGKSFEYTVQDQLLLPAAVRDMPLTRCTVGDDKRKSILAAVTEDKPLTVRWAAAVSDSGEIRVLSEAQTALLRCQEKARRIK